MPFIVSRVNIKTDKAQKIVLKEGFGKLIELIPGKTEAKVVLALEDDIFLSEAGNYDEPIAFLEVNVLNNRKHEGYDAFAKAVTKLYEDVLGIPGKNVFIKFIDMPGISREGTWQEEIQS